MKLHFVQTPNNTIRAWLYQSEKIEYNVVTRSREFLLLELLSISYGFDKHKVEDGQHMFSWELPITLDKWINERFGHYPNCTIQIHGVPIKV